jgi:hypothetical protein
MFRIDVWTMVGTLTAAAAALLTFFAIWIQARLLKKQLQVQALIDLAKEWESGRLQGLRSRWGHDERDLVALEPVLEFLEEFAGFLKRKVLNRDLLWDTTIGWHASRYYFYNHYNDNFTKLRDQWIDPTLFQNLRDELWPAYVKKEIEARKKEGMTREKLEQDLRATKPHFLKAEAACHAHRVPASPD